MSSYLILRQEDLQVNRKREGSALRRAPACLDGDNNKEGGLQILMIHCPMRSQPMYEHY